MSNRRGDLAFGGGAEVKRKQEPIFKTEAEMCAAFIAWAQAAGWVAYAETCDWDILLVDANGVQLGIQAKMTLNLKVLHQALDTIRWRDEGPDYRAVLVPVDQGMESVLQCLGLQYFVPQKDHYWRPGKEHERDFRPSLPDGAGRTFRYNAEGWHDWNPLKRHKLPEYIPDVAAGASAPIQLTTWKIAALKVCAMLELRGWVTKGDLRTFGLDCRRWVGPNDGWIIPGPEAGRYIEGSLPDFRAQHPTVYAQILNDVRVMLPDGP